MSDNERIDNLVNGLLSAINNSELPLGVKSLALENILFRVKDAIYQQEVINNKKEEEDCKESS